ncbi:MAG: fimbrillin family protein [Parabacteroides sp.]|nr:fimbrillin family protein [Parabacteroides sp.]
MNKLLKSIIPLILSLLTLSCSKEDLPGNGEEVNGGALTINVVDKGYASQDSVPDTKATTDGSYVTTFVEGDEIGVYVVANNKIVQSNVKLTKSGSGWTAGEEITSKKDNEMKFFAYYPYDASVSDEKLTATASNAEGFFATYLSEIVLPTDQSDAGKYSKADIMVGDGSLAGTALTFGMEHQMGLVVVELPTEAEQTFTYKLSTDASYTWEGVKITSVSCTDVQLNSQNALSVDGKYRYLVKPGTDDISGSFSMASESKTFTCTGSSGISAGSYKTYKVSAKITAKGEETHTLAFGDFFMRDGSILKGSDYSSDRKIPNPENCIGIVFSVDQSRIGSAEGEALLSKGVSTPHGLVMALTDASTSAQWKTSNDGNHVTAECTTRDNCKADISGLQNYNEVKKYDSDFSAFPAFAAAETYNTTVKVSSLKTTGWFLPSIGQWWDILANLGNSDFSNSNGSTTGDIGWGDYQGSKAVSAINVHLNKIGGGNVNQISSGTEYWTSSEYDSSNARNVNFYSNGALCLFCTSKGSGYRVRCVLAF